MGGGQMKTPARLHAQPGQEGRYAIAAGLSKLARCCAKRHQSGDFTGPVGCYLSHLTLARWAQGSAE